jgi:hypothetical protein
MAHHNAKAGRGGTPWKGVRLVAGGMTTGDEVSSFLSCAPEGRGKPSRGEDTQREMASTPPGCRGVRVKGSYSGGRTPG